MNGVVTAPATVATAVAIVAAVVAPAPPTGESAAHVFGDIGVLDEQAVRLAVLVRSGWEVRLAEG